MNELMLSINDTARVMGLGRTSIYHLIGTKRLEVIKVGRRTLVKTSSIRNLIGENVSGSDA